MPCLRRPSTLLKALAVRLGVGGCLIWQLEEELDDVSREINYFSEVLRYMAREQSSPQLLGPLGALASRHPHGRRSCDGRALLVVLVFASPSSMILTRLNTFNPLF